MIICAKCGGENKTATRFCVNCGSKLSAAVGKTAVSAPAPLPASRKMNWKPVLITVASLVVLGAIAWFIFIYKNESAGTSGNKISGKDKETITELVTRWNDHINAHDPSSVLNLYDEQLVYYRKQVPRNDAHAILASYLAKNPGYRQKITEEINFSKDADVITANFTKQVIVNGQTTDYPSYLRFSPRDDGWKIIEEGDKITDYNIEKMRRRNNQ